LLETSEQSFAVIRAAAMMAFRCFASGTVTIAFFVRILVRPRNSTAVPSFSNSPACFFLAHAVHTRGSDGHQNVLWSVNYSQVVREQVKSKKPGVFRMPKQSNPKTQTQTKNTTRRKTPRNLGETLRFQKMKSSERSVPLHDDIAIPASRRTFQVAHSWKKW